MPVIIFSSLIVFSCNNSVTRKITEGELRDHVKYLSSDSLKGRKTGTPGDSLAAIYIRDRLTSCGLVPLSGDGFQRYGVTDKVDEGEKNFCIVNGTEFKLSADFMPFSFSGNSGLDAEAVFAGYGFNISNDSLVWNDYKDINVKGRWVLILRGDPEPEKSVSGFVPFNSDRDKAMVAKDMGAAGVLLVSGPVFDEEDSFEALSSGDFSVDLPALRIKRTLADFILKKSHTTVADLENRMGGHVLH